MNEAICGGERRHSIWRFSLRELLLVMLAAAAFVGWGSLVYERYRRFEPSPFYAENSDWQEDIAAALKEAGEGGNSGSAFAITYSHGPSAVHRTMAYRFPLSAANEVTFARAFQSRIRQRLASAGCKVQGNASGNMGASQSTVWGYRLGRVAGALDVCFFHRGNGEGRLVVTMHEEQAWRGGLGVGVQAGS